MCASVSALKLVRLQAMSSWLAVGFSHDLGDLTVCLDDLSGWSGRGSRTSAQSSAVSILAKGQCDPAALYY